MPKKTSRPIQKTALRQMAEKLYSESDNCYVSVCKRQLAEYIKNMRELKFQKGG